MDALVWIIIAIVVVAIIVALVVVAAIVAEREDLAEHVADVGLVAGAFGGWRASRLRPAAAPGDLEDHPVDEGRDGHGSSSVGSCGAGGPGNGRTPCRAVSRASPGRTSCRAGHPARVRRPASG